MVDREPTTGNAEALCMLDAFESVGANRFNITFTDTDNNKRGFRPAQSLATVRSSFRSTLLPSCAARGTNIILRPLSPPDAPKLVQLDDLDGAALAHVAPAAFLTIRTSPGRDGSGNHQAWVAISDAGDDLPRRLRKGAGADDSASGSTRIAGHPNFKRQYGPLYPSVTILQMQPGRTVTASQLDTMGLLAAPDPVRTAPTLRVSLGQGSKRSWPSYDRTLQGAPPSRDGDKPDISRADFHWSMVCASWNFSIEEIADKLMELSSKAKENGYEYAMMTARNATAAQQRQPKERSK